MKKISSEMYPLNELRNKYSHRIRTTGFTKSRPSIVVSFKLFSNIVNSLENASEHYAEVVEKALSGLSFLTLDGMHRIEEVDYMFVDDEGQCVAVLSNGDDLIVMNHSKNNVLIPFTGDPLDNAIVSTKELKEYFIEHREDFPYLNSLAEEIDSMKIDHVSISNNTPFAARMCLQNEWIRRNIDYCINELDNLLDHASFVLIGKGN